MQGLKFAHVRYPYCGESIRVEVDCSVERQDYIEDCSVCCRPIEFDVIVDERGNPRVSVTREDD